MVLKHTHKPTHYGIQHQGNSWKGASCVWEVGEVNGNGASARQQTEKPGSITVPFLDPPPTQSHSGEVGCPMLAIT